MTEWFDKKKKSVTLAFFFVAKPEFKQSKDI